MPTPVSLPREKISAVVARMAEIDDRLSRPLDREALVKLTRERAELEPVHAAVTELEAAEKERGELESLLADPEMAAMAEAESAALDERIASLSEKVRVLLLPKDEADEKNAILEIRAGTGGDEAALFAGDLFRMYQRYADLHRWKVAGAGGESRRVRRLQGNHRQRQRQGRVRPAEIRIGRPPRAARAGDRGERAHPHLGRDGGGAARGRGCRRQDQSRRDPRRHHARLERRRSARQHHRFGDPHDPHADRHRGHFHRRSQHQNRSQAMQMLAARLYDLERQKADDERSAARRGQVGSGDRSERIRTYNFPQGRVTDHRINLTLYKLDQVLNGEALDEVIEALITEHQASLLAAEDAA